MLSRLLTARSGSWLVSAGRFKAIDTMRRGRRFESLGEDAESLPDDSADPAVAADEAQGALLQVPAGTPLLSVERLAYTYNDVPVELRRGLYRTDTHHYRNDLS